MATISIFYGIIIKMYCESKPNAPSHFHAYYQNEVAIIDISSCELIEGSLPKKQLRLVLAWAELHKDELLANWKIAMNSELPFKIDPLK